ncbi:MAG TPA: NAD-dependent epimerase/dehydratase family protein [Gammaproteobacteria bacterium]|nr:NAD-dependent epimerase/dehydratase family protein [Gammaproteobacteria bacterium]
MKPRILITGSSGLVGSALKPALEARQCEVIGLDHLATGSDFGDVRDIGHVRRAVDRCDGVVHLAAISRVLWGERDPELCRETNVGGLRNIIETIHRRKNSPWLIFASSREVYGQPETLPVSEYAQLRPMNVYGRCKVEGEQLIDSARCKGVRASTVRLSNVYGSTDDHADRVIPAFARGAVMGQPLRIDGTENTFDFTHIDDTTRGLVALVEHMTGGGDAPPPIHFLTGRPTTLLQLAEMAIDIAETDSEIRHAPPRSYDVARFYGDPSRAYDLLGWSPQVRLREGLSRLIKDFRYELNTADA